MNVKRNVGCGSISRGLLALLFVGLFFLSVAPIASADIWHYRKPIEIDHTKVDATLTDFPVLISIADTDLKNKAQDDGDDILFVNADNTIKLDHEIEYFSGSTGELQAWVSIPSLSSTENTTIYMYYGNSECGNQQNATGVWDSNYKMVQHLDETTGTHYDSTSNDNDGTQSGGVTQDATGQIDGADEFDGTNDYVDCGNTIVGNGEATFEAWVKPEHYGQVVGESYTGSGSHNYPWLQILFSTGGPKPTDNLRFQYRDDTGTAHQAIAYTTDSTPLGQWYHIAGVKTATKLELYVNGVFKGEATPTGGWGTYNDVDKLLIASQCRHGGIVVIFNGTVDEVRISATARSGDWIKTEYNNQNEPSTFYTVGDEQNGNPVQPVPELPTIILFSIGLLVLAGYAVLRRRNMWR